MTYIYSFLFCGFLCLLAQLIVDNTKLTPGHVTSLFVVFGSLLDTLGVYDKIISLAGGGAYLPITSFGHSLTHAALLGKDKGLYGICSNMLTTTSAGIVAVLVFSFVISILFKPKN